MNGRDPLRIVVLGTMATCPYGGQVWLHLNWLRGLMALGHDVWYVEDDVVWPFYRDGEVLSEAWATAADRVRRTTERVGLVDRWAVRFHLDGSCWGRTDAEIDELYRTCDVLLNLVGTELRETHMAAPFRVWVQTDPVTHELMWATGDPVTADFVRRHDMIATYGENLGAPDCGVPLIDTTYVKTRQPIDLDLWPMSRAPDAASFTTIGNYRQDHKDVDYNGQVFRWSKHREWTKFIDLPLKTGESYLLGLNVDDDDRAELVAHGWNVTSPVEMSLDVFGAYPDFIRNSRAEFTVAKDQNVRLRSGWFSERDACYLASGKPVIAQDTGFGNILPTGEGLFAVGDLEEAVAAVDAINADYGRHCHAARAIAEEYFAAPGVAQRLLSDLGAS